MCNNFDFLIKFMKILGVNVLKAGMAKIAIILILRCNFLLQVLKQANNYF